MTKETKKGIVVGVISGALLFASVGVAGYLITKNNKLPEIHKAKQTKTASVQAVLILAECPRCGEHSLEVDHSFAVANQTQNCKNCGYALNYDLKTKETTQFSEGYGSFQVYFKDNSIDSGVFFEEPTESNIRELQELIESEAVNKEKSFIKVIRDNVIVEL